MLDYGFLQAQVYVAIVAEEGSFSRAARRLRTSQSFVTKRIASLERTLGARLFDRTTRRLELTAAGRRLLPDVQLALRHAERAWELARYSATIESLPIRIGYSSYIHTGLLPLLYQTNLSDLEARRIDPAEVPEPRPELESTDTPELIERVLRGQLQAGVGVQPIEDRDLWVETVAREGLCICISKNHGLAQRPAVSARDLHGQSLFWISRRVHPAFYDRTLEYIQSTGAHPVLHEVGSMVHAIDIAARGFGIALLPRAASRLSHPGVVFKPVTDRFLLIETAIFARRDLLQGAHQEFVQFLSSQLQSLKLIFH
jgi:LysR family transcriptional regulator, benzoate and cis,cis-muconate-responsive activator of ben and cat genes